MRERKTRNGEKKRISGMNIYPGVKELKASMHIMHLDIRIRPDCSMYPE